MLEARAPSRQRTYLALRLDAFDEAGEDEEPGAEQTQHQLPPQAAHVVQALAHVQHVLAADAQTNKYMDIRWVSLVNTNHRR